MFNQLYSKQTSESECVEILYIDVRPIAERQRTLDHYSTGAFYGYISMHENANKNSLGMMTSKH